MTERGRLTVTVADPRRLTRQIRIGGIRGRGCCHSPLSPIFRWKRDHWYGFGQKLVSATVPVKPAKRESDSLNNLSRIALFDDNRARESLLQWTGNQHRRVLKNPRSKCRGVRLWLSYI